jgi:predicted ferric reductase
MAVRIGTRVIVVLAALAAGWTALATGDAWSDGGPAAALKVAGRAAGILGLLLLLLAAVLSARIPRLDRWFGGLTDLWQVHHVLGGISLVLLMAHPLLLSLAAGAAADTPAAAVDVLFPPGLDWATWTGWISLVLMMVFLAPSFAFFGRPHYERWKKLHRLAAPAVVFALIHAAQFGALLPEPAYRAVLGGFGLAALASLIWHLGLARRFARLHYRVERVISIANNVVELALVPTGKRTLEYEAGQFVYLTPLDRELSAGHGEEHPYTLTSAPEEPHLSVAIKSLGDATRAIQTIRPGSPVRIDGPFGYLFPGRSKRNQIWIAGGIGIAPFLGRIRHLAYAGSERDIHLIYCVQDEARARFAEELNAFADSIDWFALHLHLFYSRGPLDRSFLLDCCPDTAGREAFVCGPPPLDRLARRLLRETGIPRRLIHHESFELL